MPVVMTEAELRELWQNGRSVLPAFPVGTRFSPSARDFLRDQHLEIRFAEDESAASFNLPPLLFPAEPTGEPKRSKLPEPVPARKTIFTEQDVDELVRQGPSSLVVDETVILTDLARERAERLGLKLVTTKVINPSSAVPISHNPAVLAQAPVLAPVKEILMHKTFYTDLDIEELHQRGVTRLDVNDQVVLTELAREKAQRLGIALVTVQSAGFAGETTPDQDQLFQQVKAAVLVRLGGAVDEHVLDEVIRKVLDGLR